MPEFAYSVYHRDDEQEETTNCWCHCSWRTISYIIFSILILEVSFVVFSGAHLYTWPHSVIVDYNRVTDLNYTPEMSADQFIDTYTAICEGMKSETRSQTHDVLNSSNLWDTAESQVHSKLSCPCVPPGLMGRLNISMTEAPTGETDLALEELTSGGSWHPFHCRPRHNTAIIVPFRDREEHLRIFLQHMHPILQRQQLSYTIFIVEQSSAGVFNKGQMMNIGFHEASEIANFDCYVFHDVDMLAEDDRNMYTCSERPRHVGAYCDKFNYSVPYAGLFGGATAFTKEQFEKANGFTTLFYGWGGEDDDMYRRVQWAGMKVVRYPASVARYTMMKHDRDKGNPYNTKSVAAWRYRPAVYRRDGLNSLHYQRNAIEQRPHYTWISAAIPTSPMPENDTSEISSSAVSKSSSLSRVWCLLLLLSALL